VRLVNLSVSTTVRGAREYQAKFLVPPLKANALSVTRTSSSTTRSSVSRPALPAHGLTAESAMLLPIRTTGQESVLLVTRDLMLVIFVLDPTSATVLHVKMVGMLQVLPQTQPVVPVVMLSARHVLDLLTQTVSRVSRPCTIIKAPLVGLLALLDSSELLKRSLLLRAQHQP